MQETEVPVNNNTIDWAAMWGVGLQQATCSICDASYLMLESMARFGQERCPNCSRSFLQATEATVAQPDLARQPELILDFKITPQQAMNMLVAFTAKIKSPPPDLTKENLTQRMRRVFLPVWLVDATVNAQWGAEAGFNYDVVSHHERHAGNRWVTEEIKKTRVSWEPRVGTLTRRYDNVHASALEGYFRLEKQINNFDEKAAEPYTVDKLNDAYILLPDRSTEDAWKEATLGIKQRGEGDVYKALGADRTRDFKWTPKFSQQNWTLLLVPLYTTYYLDDDEMPQVLFVNGQQAGVNGALRGSMKRARRFVLPAAVVATLILGVSLLIGLISILTGLFFVVALSILGILSAVFVVILAFAPVAAVSVFNNKYDGLRAFFKPYRPELNQTLGQ